MKTVTLRYDVPPHYEAISAVSDIVDEWIGLLEGNEWGESMRSLQGACHTNYGLSDEFCAICASLLLDNLVQTQESGWLEEARDDYKLHTQEQADRTAERARERRDYWLRGGNLGDWGTTKANAKFVIDQMPKWIFGEER